MVAKSTRPIINVFRIIALASNDEVREWLAYITDCHPDLAKAVVPLIAENETIGRMLTRLIQASV